MDSKRLGQLQPGFRILEYGTESYRQMVELRDKVLRKPLGLTFNLEFLESERNDILIGCFDIATSEQPLLGCCILSPSPDKGRMQLRQMAVVESFQRAGIGKLIVRFAEQEALQRNIGRLFLHARAYAVPFYQKMGYQTIGPSFIEVGLPHFIMEKELQPC